MVNTKKKKLSQAEKIAKARAIIDSQKKEMQRDAKICEKNGAVNYDELESQRIITSKLKEKIQRQNDYRGQLLMCNVKNVRLEMLDKLLREAIEIKKDGTYTILKETINWQGTEEYTKVMIQEYELERHYLKLAVANMNYSKQALINEGMTSEEIEQVALGSYIKTEKAAEESEKKLKELENKEKDTEVKK